MADATPPEEFADVNEAVAEDWVTETTPYERVRTVIRTTYTQVSADTVAETARTTPKTARKHLENLAEEGYVTTEPGEYGATQYRRSPESLVVEQAAEILEEVSTDELVDRIGEMRDRLEELRSEYGADSPEELTVERANQTLSGDKEATEIAPAELQEWQTTRRNLAFANAALSIANAERFVDGDTSSTDGSIPSSNR
jgi:predicted ArsR family transcriptional regulator